MDVRNMTLEQLMTEYKQLSDRIINNPALPKHERDMCLARKQYFGKVLARAKLLCGDK